MTIDMSKKILVIITGSIAAYKSVSLIRNLEKKSYQVKVILTRSAQKFITKLLVTSLIGEENVYTQLFDEKEGMSHINLSRQSDLVIIAPSSADFIAKIANGYCDDLASTVVAACDKKVMIAPAMNEKMWRNSANIENIAKLKKSDKFLIINPVEDVLACKEKGVGKMEDPDIILAQIDEYFTKSSQLKGKTVILTGGGTREAIDSVRYISNNSSGKQALALCDSLKSYGANVIFVAANISCEINLPDDQIHQVKSCDEMLSVVNELISTFQVGLDNLIFISCAAVADYKTKTISDVKIKKGEEDEISIKLVKNIDILKTVGNSVSRPKIVVGFAAEDSENILENAKNKLAAKKCDLIVANDIKKGKIFDSLTSEAHLITKNQVISLENLSKKEVANQVVKKIIEIL